MCRYLEPFSHSSKALWPPPGTTAKGLYPSENTKIPQTSSNGEDEICGVFVSSTFCWNADWDVSKRILSDPYNIRFMFNNALIVRNNNNRFALFIELVQQRHNNISVFLVK